MSCSIQPHQCYQVNLAQWQALCLQLTCDPRCTSNRGHYRISRQDGPFKGKVFFQYGRPHPEMETVIEIVSDAFSRVKHGDCMQSGGQRPTNIIDLSDREVRLVYGDSSDQSISTCITLYQGLLPGQ